MTKLTPILISLAAAATLVTPSHAQESTSREVVQPLPSKEVQRLNRALLQLAKLPKSVDALLEAGDASSAVGDLDAALGFYGRAQDLAPDDTRITLGIARVFLKSGRPVQALPLFAQAQAAGAEARELLSDRALAFDLVGDTASAQPTYTQAIALNPKDTEAQRRLALSYAISGNRAAFEATLRPLLDDRDFAAFRTRAFGLAILGEQDRATAIVDAVMPRDLAARINPYLAYMPRLTKAQQAAAANLGIFPRVADIGRDDPVIAAYVSGVPTSTSSSVRTADSKLAPSGQPLGRAQKPEPSVADAFADMKGVPMPNAAGGQGAVDLAAIDVPREPVEPPPPAHPSRIWVQVATGRDLNALKFDWRRMVRKAPELLGKYKPHVTPWGQANRLLAGPIESRNDARKLVNELRDEGVETFSYTSPEGTEVKQLN